MCLSSDNHDIISMKVYQLTVERTPEEQEEEEVTIPTVDNVRQFQGRSSPPHNLLLHIIYFLHSVSHQLLPGYHKNMYLASISA